MFHEIAAFAVLSLCLLYGNVDVLACDENGPEACTFQSNTSANKHGNYTHTMCSWGFDDASWTWHNDSTTLISGATWVYDWFPGLAGGSAKGVLTSRKSCSTNGETFCFSFVYRIIGTNAVDLNVNVVNAETEERLVAWSVSNSSWYKARVPVSTVYDFFIEIEAVRRSGSSVGTVYIDNIQYWNSSSCTLSPSRATSTNEHSKSPTLKGGVVMDFAMTFAAVTIIVTVV